MKRHLLRAFVVLSALGCAAVYAHPVLSFTEQAVTQPPKDSKDKPRSSEFPVTVSLGHEYLSVDAEGVRQIYDFKERRLYRLKLADKTYESTSLYSVLGFNALEMQNRMAVGTMVSAAQAQDDSQSPAMVEHLFSIPAEGQNTVIDSANANGATVFSWKGKELLSVSDKTQPLPADYQREYWRYLRYAIGGHPKIYDEMQKRTGVPELIRTTRPGLLSSTITLRLTKITNGADTPYSLAGFTRSVPKREPYLTIAKVVSSDGPAALAARSEAAKRYRDEATAEGRILDAALAHFTYALSTGDNGQAWLTESREAMMKSEDARAFAASLSVKKAEDAERAVKTLEALRARNTSPYAYLFDVFAANHHMALKHSTEAQKLFLASLAENPYLVGAWFDLGRLYYASFKTQDAWACWDVARAINRNHPFARNVDSMEQQMAAANPEFF